MEEDAGSGPGCSRGTHDWRVPKEIPRWFAEGHAWPFPGPSLSLQDFGGIQAGSFRFSKGDVTDFHYKNLSSGEKAAFDILLDVFLKRDEAKEAVFCIDEPELHVATGLQGPLIASVLALLRETSQLWIATHSIGIVRQARIL